MEVKPSGMVLAHVNEIAIDDLGGGIHPPLGTDIIVAIRHCLSR